MPIAPLRQCTQPGCYTLVVRGRCEEHSHTTYERRRGTRTQRGYGKRWQRIRLLHLGREPLCVECAKRGLVVAATDVDHIIPHRGNEELLYDEGNLQSLCHACHSRKTARGG